MLLFNILNPPSPRNCGHKVSSSSSPCDIPDQIPRGKMIVPPSTAPPHNYNFPFNEWKFEFFLEGYNYSTLLLFPLITAYKCTLCNSLLHPVRVLTVNRNQYASFSPCILTLTSDLPIYLHYNPLHCYWHPSQSYANASQWEDWWGLYILICCRRKALERHCYCSDSTKLAKN